MVLHPCLDILQEASQVHQPQEASQVGPLVQHSPAVAEQQLPAELTVLLHHRHHPHQNHPDCLISSFGSLKTEQ